MSSITAVGVRLGIFGPPPVAPARSLIKTAGVLQEGEGRWLNGVEMFPYPVPINVAQWNPCDSDTKSGGDNGDIEIFDPVAIYLEVVCTTSSIEGLQERARVSFEAGTPAAVESLVVAGNGAGVGGNTNPFLGDTNVTILNGGVAVAPREGMAILEDSIAANYGATGMIHATPGTVDLLSAILEEDDNGTIYTQAGTPVVPGQGYVGAEADGNAPGDLQTYMFASPPIEVFLSEPSITDLRSSLDRSDNAVSFIVERFALAVWDIAALQTAVLVDWALATS
jgi:hypothetical protein